MVQVEVTIEITKHLELNDNVNTADPNLWNAARALTEMYELKWKALSICIVSNKGENKHLNLEVKWQQNKTQKSRS